MAEIERYETERQKDFINRIYEINSRKDKKPLAFIETYGCAQNFNDSEKLSGMLCDMGYDFCEDKTEADLIIFNTCAVRENAEMRVYGNIGAIKNIKCKKEGLILGVCGCMMQQEQIADNVKKRYPYVDMVFGTHALYRFPEILSKAMEKSRVFDTENSDGAICEDISCRRDAPPLAKIPIMHGCNNFCTYCIVPYVRGRERSRKMENILSEIREVANEGYKEVMLLGQNVNSYGNDFSDGTSFAGLLKEVCKIDGIERVRFMTSHPKDISDELIEVMAAEDKICKQLHLPVQCGSSRVLEMMNRRYTKEKYLDIVRKVKEKMPDIVLTTDIIVGFPGETNEDFNETIDVLEKVRYDTIFSFIYSKRPGTPAAVMEDCLSDEEKHKNFDKLLEVQNRISKEKNDEYLGKTEKVLVEGESKNNPEYMCGRTEGGKVVNFKGDKEDIGKILDIKITKTQTWSLSGEKLEEN